MKKKYLIISSLLLIIFLVITYLMITKNMNSFDQSIYNYLIGKRSDFLDTYFTNITKLANTSTIIIVLCILLLTTDKKYSNILVLCVSINIIINNMIKYIIRRPRPNHLRLIKEWGYSYPSGHSMASIAIYGFLIYYIYKKIENIYLKISLITILSLLIISIGLSRIYVGVHYPSDVLAGFVLAISISIIIIITYNYYMGVKKNAKTTSNRL